MTKKWFCVMLMVVLSSTLVYAGPLRREHVPAAVQWIFHADFDAFRTSQIGTLIQQEVLQEHKEKIDAFTQLLGTDLTKDIHAVTLYGIAAGDENVSALFYGKFDKDKLISLLILNPAYTKSEYNGNTLHHWADDKSGKNQVGAFAADGLIVIGQNDAGVIMVLDVISGILPSLSEKPDAPLYSLCNVSPSTFVIAAANGVADLVQDDQHAAILKKSHMMSLVGFENDGRLNLNIKLETDDEVAAEQIEQVVRGMMAFASLNQDKHPQLGTLLGACTLIREANSISFNFEYSSDKLYDLVQALKEQGIALELTGDTAGIMQ